MTTVFVGILANLLPWVLVTRCTFIYHFFATVPFIILSAYICCAAMKRGVRSCIG
jgi:dolichyl-phosphate-mannose--protein O-mannosyl transferase